MARLASGRASRTARITAAMRARHMVGGATPRVFEDRFARYFLDFGSFLLAAPTPVTDWVLGRLLGPVRALEGEVLARSRYVEEELARMMAGGLRQMLVLGAGFDTTALKHAGSDLQVFEVDHPATQAEKQSILARHPELAHDTVFVPVDFAHDDLVTALDEAGFDRKAESLVSWLGVTMYLDEATVFATLASVRSRVAKGSRLIFDAYPGPADLSPEDRLLFAATRALTASQGEPMVPWFSRKGFADGLSGKDWRLVEMIDGQEMRARWFANQPEIIKPPYGAVFVMLEAE
jgi:methyltransferase (TIGR00027 family)